MKPALKAFVTILAGTFLNQAASGDDKQYIPIERQWECSEIYALAATQEAAFESQLSQDWVNIQGMDWQQRSDGIRVFGNVMLAPEKREKIKTEVSERHGNLSEPSKSDLNQLMEDAASCDHQLNGRQPQPYKSEQAKPEHTSWKSLSGSGDFACTVNYFTLSEVLKSNVQYYNHFRSRGSYALKSAYRSLNGLKNEYVEQIVVEAVTENRPRFYKNDGTALWPRIYEGFLHAQQCDNTYKIPTPPIPQDVIQNSRQP